VSASLNTTQLRGQFNLDNSYLAPLNSSCSLAILEPYISSPNFYNSDQNALLNDVFENRLSTKFQDIDYNTGALTPTNFELLISGSATKAMVQDSNYTTKRHILPRYEGSKSTSQFLNKWSPPNTILGYKDEGTYGKQPTVESLKNYVAYCDFIGGWPPERMNASGAHILYLIKDDGTIVIPNTSENSLSINKGTFESNERVSITSKNISTSGETNFRNIIRGGTKIEPILYTQIGHSPATWSPVTMSFTTDFVSDLTSVGDYQATSYPSQSVPTMNDASLGGLDFNNNIYLGNDADPWTNNRYNITQSLIDENISLTIKGRINSFLQHPILGGQNHIVTVNLIYSSSLTGESILQTQTVNSNLSSYPGTGQTFLPSMYFEYVLDPQDMRDGDSIFFRGGHFTSTYGPTVNTARYLQNSYFKVEQSPSPTDINITSSGTNSIWGYPNTSSLFAITASQTLSNLYDKNFTQIDISGSGFNPISLPWSIKYGDEFRFEGNENQVYSVKTIYSPGSNDDRLFNSSSIEVHFNSPLPVNASSSIFNLDHFLIRRYVDDASLILLEGFKPTGADGPFLIKPEFVTPELNKSIDQVIVDLTQKGLL
jgi:hypothetical protein